MEIIIKPGQKMFSCLACGCRHTSPIREHVLMVRCSNCGLPFCRAVRARPSRVHGIGLGPRADLGLTILMEAQTDV